METGETARAPEIKSQLQTFGRERLLAGTYSLDLSALWEVPVKVNGEPSSFVEAYCKLRDSKAKEDEDTRLGLRRSKYVAEDGEIELECEWPLLATMRELTEFTRQGVDPHHVNWFYYAHDWSRDGDERYSFFAVHDGKIIMESCDFSSWEPRVLKRREVGDDPVWHSHPYFDEAFERYWYRNFYTETVTGQLMVLRPDQPILYHYERPQARDIAREVQLVTHVKIYRLLGVSIPLLAAIAFPSMRDYLAIAAGALGIEFLWLCWRTRKVGRT